MSEFQPGPDDLVIPFIFVPHGAPDPTEWLARHPGAIRIPAVMVPHTSGTSFSKNLRFDMDTALDRIFRQAERSRARILQASHRKERTRRTKPQEGN